MRQVRLKPVPALIVMALASLAIPAFSKSRQSKDHPNDLTVPVPSFSIAVRLSETAQLQLQKMHETILVIAYFDGDALPGQGQYNAPFRDVYLGSDQKLVDSQNMTIFDTTKISQSGWNRLANKDYFLTINIVSARHASKNNLLWCGVPEDRLSTFQGKTTEVSCDLINDHNPPQSIPGSALKSIGNSPK
jgi:hypothetical protein